MIVMYKHDSNGKIARHESYTGATLCTRERNWPNDSEWYAVVWDEKEDKLKEVIYATTMGGHTENNKAVVDATPDIINKAGVWLATWIFTRWQQANEEQAQLVKVGKTVRVVHGRKVPIGLNGNVTEIRDYAPNEWTCIKRVVIEANGRMYVTNISNVVVDHPEQYLQPISDGRKLAAAVVREGHWHLPFVRYGMLDAMHSNVVMSVI